MLTQRLQKPIYLIEGLRTPIGRKHKSLKEFTAASLAAEVIHSFVQRYPVATQDIDAVILGNAVSAGTGQNIARQALCAGGLSSQIPAIVLNSVCGSGMEAVMMACRLLLCQEARLVLAGGTESASQSPQILSSDASQARESLVWDGLWCSITNKHMGHIAEDLASRSGISAQRQNLFAYQSHQKAALANTQGKLKSQMVPLRKSDGTMLVSDDSPRASLSLETINNLPPAFRPQGTITAGNASAPADAAALLLLASDESIAIHGELQPKAKVVCYASVGIEPDRCFEAGVLAVRECLRLANLKVGDIDLFEIGEAFAVQVLWTKEQLGIPDEQMNIYGGDIALGHPLGSASARLLVTLLHALEHEHKKRGIGVMCFGSGGASSILIERL